jgi:hypothetical protein
VHDEVQTVVVENDDEMGTTTGSAVFECFEDHPDGVTIHSLDIAVVSSGSNARLSCQVCGLELLCACCERRVNFK